MRILGSEGRDVTFSYSIPTEKYVMLGRFIPISKHSSNGTDEDSVINSVITVEALKLSLCVNFLNMSNVFMNLATKITISIPEKSSVAIALYRVKASNEHVHSKPATISI
ncbi:MAG: hypothetical protein JXR82_01145 [Marinifilaceae bacterium]|nr:hypothetical protein [Marinifilaceae bacterium]